MTGRPITTGANSEMNQSDFLAVVFACHRWKKVARDLLADHQAKQS